MDDFAGGESIYVHHAAIGEQRPSPSSRLTVATHRERPIWPGDALAAELASFKLTLDLLRARPFRLDAHAHEELVSLSQELLGSFAWR
jgi:hypothetical protein